MHFMLPQGQFARAVRTSLVTAKAVARQPGPQPVPASTVVQAMANVGTTSTALLATLPKTGSNQAHAVARSFVDQVAAQGVPFPGVIEQSLATLLSNDQADAEALDDFFASVSDVVRQSARMVNAPLVLVKPGMMHTCAAVDGHVIEVRYDHLTESVQVALFQKTSHGQYSAEEFLPPTLLINGQPLTLPDSSTSEAAAAGVPLLKKARSHGRNNIFSYNASLAIADLMRMPFGALLTVASEEREASVLLDAQSIIGTPEFRGAPLWNLFAGDGAVDLELASPDLQVARTQAEAFEQQLATIRDLTSVEARVEALERLERQHGLGQLTMRELCALFHAYKAEGAWQSVARLFELSANREFVTSDVIREFYLVALNKVNRSEVTIAAAEQFLDGGWQSRETYCALGKAHKNAYDAVRNLEEELAKPAEAQDPRTLRNVSRAYWAFFPGDTQLEALEDNRELAWQSAFVAYERGFLLESHYYPGINMVYLLRDAGRVEEARNLAQLVYRATVSMGGQHSPDYWAVVTLMELALFLENVGEVEAMIPHVLARVPHAWQAEASAQELMRSRRAKIAAGESTNLLDAVILALVERAEAMLGALDGTENGRASALRKNLGTIRSIVEADGPAMAFDPVSTAPTATPIMDAVRASAFEFDSFDSAFIAGSIPYGGQLHSTVFNRRDVELGQQVVERLGLDTLSDPFAVLDRLDAFLATRFGLQTETGERPLETLDTPEHREMDRIMRDVMAYMGVASTSDSRTNLMADVALGRGDCRHANYAMAFLFNVWKAMRTRQLLIAEHDAWSRGNMSAYGTSLAQARDIDRFHLMVFDVDVQGALATESHFVEIFGRDFDVPVRDAAGRYVERPEGAHRTEEHTLTGLIVLNDDGEVTSGQLRDAFYHQAYPWKTFDTDFSTLATHGTIAAGSVVAVDAEGKEVRVPITLKPTTYAGERSRENVDEGGQFRVRGHITDVPDAAVFFDQREGVEHVLAQVRHLGVSATDFLRQLMTTDIDAAASGSHNEGWKAAKDLDLANANNPFVGASPTTVTMDAQLKDMADAGDAVALLTTHFGRPISDDQVAQIRNAVPGQRIAIYPMRARVSAELKAMDRAALSAFLGVNISEDKYAALQAAPDGQDITHSLYHDYPAMLAQQDDGGARMGGQNAMPMWVLASYFADYFAEETGGEPLTKMRLMAALRALQDGSDEYGARFVNKLQHTTFQGAQMVHGDRAFPTQQRVMIPTDQMVTSQGRGDFKPFGVLPTDVQALDGWTVGPVAQYMLRGLTQMVASETD
jgi:hypothetical protein